MKYKNLMNARTRAKIKRARTEELKTPQLFLSPSSQDFFTFTISTFSVSRLFSGVFSYLFVFHMQIFAYYVIYQLL